MAYGNGQGQRQGYQNNRAPAAAAAPKTAAAAPVSGKREGDIFTAFLNKSGNGYSVKLDETLTIPAGTRISLFLDTIKSKKDGTEYQVVKVKKMKERVQG
jgi:hypothetical protein